MATVRIKKNSKGQTYYEIRVYRKSDQKQLSMNWYIPEGWSKKAIDKELAKQSAQFEISVNNGTYKTKKETKLEQKRALEEEQKIYTLERFFSEVYLPKITLNLAEQTRYSYSQLASDHILPVIGKKKITDITTADLSSLFLSLQQGEFKHSTIIKIYSVASQLFKTAYNLDIIDKNPMDKVERPKAPDVQNITYQPEFFTLEEVQHILSSLDNAPMKWKIYIMILLETGCRRGEACALTWNDIDFDNNAITFSKSTNYTPDKGAYIGTTKNKKARTDYISNELIELLRQYKETNSRDKVTNNVFTEENSSVPMFPQSPNKYFNKFGKKNNIEHFHPHKLRHTLVSLGLQNGIDVGTVSAIVGHSNPSVTQRFYQHVNNDNVKIGCNKFLSAIKNTPRSEVNAV